MNTRLPDAAARSIARLIAQSVIRPLREDDRGRLGAFFDALTPASRHQRFHAAVNSLPEPWLTRLMRVDGRDSVAFVATAAADDREVIIGEARYGEPEEAGDAREVALVVADAWQGIGLGRRLLTALVRHAAQAGFGRLFGDVVHSNVAMLSLARRLGFRQVHHPGDARMARVSLALHEWHESAAGGHAIEETMPT